MNAWVPGLCLLTGISVTWAAVAGWSAFRRHRDKPHPLAPVVPLRTHYVRVVPEPRRRWEA